MGKFLGESGITATEHKRIKNIGIWVAVEEHTQASGHKNLGRLSVELEKARGSGLQNHSNDADILANRHGRVEPGKVVELLDALEKKAWLRGSRRLHSGFVHADFEIDLVEVRRRRNGKTVVFGEARA